MPKLFDPYDFSKKEIDGVAVYYKNLPWASCLNVYVVFSTGAFSDPFGKEGLSHFLEHMIFDGSPKLKNKKAIQDWSKKYALNSWNAWTDYYQTVYHLKCLPENYKQVLLGMKDMIFNSYLREEDVKHEKGVITQEAWRRYINEKYLLYTKEALENTYHGHNLARVSCPLGWPKTIAGISQPDLKKWHADNYTKGNFSIVVTGAVEEKHIDLLKDFVKNIPKKNLNKYVKGTVQKPLKLKIVKNSDEIGDPKEQAEVSIMRATDYLSEKVVQKADLFRSLLSDLLNEKLRFEMGVCYSVSVMDWLGTDMSDFSMNVKTDEKNIDIVQKEFLKIIKEIVSGKHKEKFNTLKKVAIEQKMSRELVSDQIAHYATEDLSRYGDKIITLEEELKQMKAVTYKDIASFAKEIFDPKWTFTEIILPSKK